ncbi:two-partner secretion domain-containing protein [Calothrix sp. 336/3]|uniref:two-partner secretion domain-containing protein n=1 Tax=Calothrix sp. 336/3 TaxID=1337936 RepID=UPI000553244A|nr:filamentous hemagglutinin N-terminal domain-containing protein [Calothrix sp. 336/3]AKG21526.1 hypothetical protein IJ00_09765 [Calothrix sp. 336/3]
MKNPNKSSLLALFITSLLSLVTINSVKAQVSPDGTLSTTVTDSNSTANYLILNGNRQGNNLFHSFKEFSIPRNGAAVFQNANDIQNIFSRVTGGFQSNIDGLLKTQGNANLFLINPAGILFGQNAKLDVGGSFFATTASSVLFSDGVEFSATNTQKPPVLTVNIPIGLKFRDNPSGKGITVQGQGHNLTFDATNLEFTRQSTPPGLSVKSGRTLALLGEQVNLTGGNLLADGGKVEVGGVGSGVVSLTPVNQGWQLGYNNVSSFGNITLSQKASIDTSSNLGAGEIQVRGKNIRVIDGAAIFAFTGSQSGKNILVDASENLEVQGTGVSVNGTKVPSAIYSAVSTNGLGNGSNLIIHAKNFLAQGGVQIGADTFGIGNGGTTLVKVDESLQILGKDIETKIPTALGNFVQASATQGIGASLIVETQKLKIADGGQLVTGTLSSGKGATLVLKAFEFTEIGKDSVISSLVGTGASGDGGIIFLETPRLVIDGGKITVDGQGTGNAGNVFVTSGSVRLLNQGSITAESKSGNGGNIQLNLQDFLFMRGKSLISTSAIANTGNGGNITITIPNGFVIGAPLENSDIKANAFNGQGGNVIITANGIFGFVPRSRAELQQLLNTTDPAQLDPAKLPTNDITAISQQNPNLSGEVTINTADIDPGRGLIELPEDIIDTTQAIAQHSCKRRVRSEFIVTGRGGIALDPTQFLPSDNTRVNLAEPVTPISQKLRQVAKETTPKPIIPARGWVMNDKGEVILTAYDPTSTLPERESQKLAVCQETN